MANGFLVYLIVGKLNFTKLPGVEVAKSSLRLERKEFN